MSRETPDHSYRPAPAVGHGARRDQDREDVAVAVPDEELAGPGAVAADTAQDDRGLPIRAIRPDHLGGDGPHDLIGGPAVEAGGGVVPVDDTAVEVRSDHGFAERVEDGGAENGFPRTLRGIGEQTLGVLGV
jgi:hypothetical protein